MSGGIKCKEKQGRELGVAFKWSLCDIINYCRKNPFILITIEVICYFSKHWKYKVISICVKFVFLGSLVIVTLLIRHLTYVYNISEVIFFLQNFAFILCTM